MKKPVNQIRIKSEKHAFTIIYNQVIRDQTLSAKSFKIFAFLLSQKQDFNINISGLAKLTGNTRNTITKIFKELEEKGYLKKIRFEPNETNNGKIQYIYELNQTPIKAEEESLKDWLTDDKSKEELKREYALKYEESLKSILNIDKIKQDKALSDEIAQLIEIAKTNIWK